MAHLGDKLSKNVPDRLRQQILDFYGSLDDPGWPIDLMERGPWKNMYAPFLGDLAAELLQDLGGLFSIATETDVNSDSCLVLRICSVDSWSLELSLVGRYAALFRAVPGPARELFEPTQEARSSHEKFLIELLKKHQIEILGAEILTLPFDLKHFYTDPENAKVYQALFRDMDILPWRQGKA